MKKLKSNLVTGVIGVIILIFGIIGTLAIAVNGEQYIYGLILTGLAVIIGVILIAIAMSD